MTGFSFRAARQGAQDITDASRRSREALVADPATARLLAAVHFLKPARREEVAGTLVALIGKVAAGHALPPVKGAKPTGRSAAASVPVSREALLDDRHIVRVLVALERLTPAARARFVFAMAEQITRLSVMSGRPR